MSPATPPDDDGKLIEELDAGEPARTPEEAAARRPYQRLIERIQDLDEIEPLPGWEARAEQRWHAQRADAQRADARKRRLRRGALALSLGGAALAAALLLRPCTSTPAPEISPAQAQVVVTTTRSGAQRRGEPTVGDELHAETRIQAKHGELRVYRGTTLIARCPGDPRCQVSAPRLAITLELTEEGTYRAVALSHDAPIPEPGPNGLDSDILDAQSAGVAVSRGHTITVHR